MYVDMDVSVSDTVCRNVAISRSATLGKGKSAGVYKGMSDNDTSRVARSEKWCFGQAH